MCQVEIPREEWQTFCEQFTRQHHSWIINVRVADAGADITAGTAASEARRRMHPLDRSAVFCGVSIEPHGETATAAITVGVPPDQVVRRIDNPQHLFFRYTEKGAHEELAIESTSGETTLLRFRAAALPEDIDGLAVAELEVNGVDEAVYGP